MANILGPSALPLNSTDASTKGELKLLKPVGDPFSAALVQAKEKAVASITTSLQMARSNAIQTTTLLASSSLASSNVPVPHAPLRAAQNEAGEDSFHERALGLRAYRQQLLASNIANADTPGYKAVDIDIQEALRTGKTPQSVDIKYAVPSQGSVDGNTVDMDSERAKFTENAIMYEYEVDRVKGHYKDMDDLLKGTPY